MNKFNKLVFSTLSLLALTVMTSCEGGGLTIEDAVANQRVMDAMEQMTTTEIESFEIDVTADFDYLQRVFDEQLTVLEQRHLDAAGEVHVKVNDLFGDDAVGSVIASASILAEENGEVLVDVEADAAIYLSDGWVYADVTGVTEIITAMGETPPEITTIKKYVGNLATAIGYDPTQPIELPFDMTTMLPYMNTIDDIVATESDGELTVVYTITMNDVVDVFMKVMEEAGEFNPEELTSEQIEEYRNIVLTQLSSVVELTRAKFTIGVGADGFLSKLYADLNLAVTVPGEVGHEVHEVEGSLHIDIDNMNQIVDVVLPDNLDTYTEMPEEVA